MRTFIPRGKIFGPIIPQFVFALPVSMGAKLLYTLLCNYAGDKDHCWPSHSTLAGRLSCSVSSVKNYLRELETVELIVIKRGQYRSSIYYMLDPEQCKEQYKIQQAIQPNSTAQQTNFEATQSTFDGAGSNSGYINNLNKQNKEKLHPLPPAGLETHKSSFDEKKALVGGVFPPAHDFLTVWEAYPKKEGKGLARMAWAKLHQQEMLPPLDDLLQAIERFATSPSWQKEDGRFIPQMSNWLRGERWADEVRELSAHEKQAQIVIKEQERLHAAQEARQAEEEEKRQQEFAIKEALRPQFDAFATAAKFVLPANSSPTFGRWLYLHEKGIAPTADDVPKNYTADIGTFLKDYQRQCELAKNTQIQTSAYQIPYAQTAMPCLQKAV